MQAALQEAVCVGTTPRELGMMALSALTSWQACGSQQQAGLQPQHVAVAIRGWMAQHDSRVSNRDQRVCGFLLQGPRAQELGLCMAH